MNIKTMIKYYHEIKKTGRRKIICYDIFMDRKWRVVYYEIKSDEYPVKEFIDNLDAKAKSKIINALDLLTEFGIGLGLPHSKKLTGTNLWELRILGKENIRIFYVAVVNQKFLLLHAFQKKKQKTDKREIKIAEERLKDYKSRLKRLL